MIKEFDPDAKVIMISSMGQFQRRLCYTGY